MNEIAFLPESGTRTFWFGNTRVALRVPSGCGADGISIVEHWMPHGEAPPLHIHHGEDEAFHILAGVMRFRLAGRDMMLRAGDTFLAPKGIPHGFRVESPESAHCLTICRGGEFESMVRETGRPACGPGLPPWEDVTPETMAGLIAACARHRIEVIGAPIAAETL